MARLPRRPQLPTSVEALLNPQNFAQGKHVKIDQHRIVDSRHAIKVWSRSNCDIIRGCVRRLRFAHALDPEKMNALRCVSWVPFSGIRATHVSLANDALSSLFALKCGPRQAIEI